MMSRLCVPGRDDSAKNTMYTTLYKKDYKTTQNNIVETTPQDENVTYR